MSDQQATELPTILLSSAFPNSFDSAELAEMLGRVISTQRWFRSKARQTTATRIVDWFDLAELITPELYIYWHNGSLAIVAMQFADGSKEFYAVPLVVLPADQIDSQIPVPAQLARVQVTKQGPSAVLCDGLADPQFVKVLLQAVTQSRTIVGQTGKLLCRPNALLTDMASQSIDQLPVKIGDADQSNSMAIFGDRLLLKVFRKLEAGENPDLEICQYLTETVSFAHVPPVAGAIEYLDAGGGSHSLAMLQQYVPNQGVAWTYTLDQVRQYFASQPAKLNSDPAPDPLPIGSSLVELAQEDLPPFVAQMLGEFAKSAELLGRRTGELHLALASHSDRPAFAPEPLDAAIQLSMHESMVTLADDQLAMLSRQRPRLPAVIRPLAEQLLARQGDLRRGYGGLLAEPLGGQIMRIHGDYHLGQVLYTGSDFVIIDFEGEPARSLAERRQKRPPLQDVAGMIRSFHYAASTVLFQQLAATEVSYHSFWRKGAPFWYYASATIFLRAYLATVGQASFLPQQSSHLETLLNVLLLDKAVYELGYELNNRPDWIEVPLHGILDLLPAQ